MRHQLHHRERNEAYSPPRGSTLRAREDLLREIDAALLRAQGTGMSKLGCSHSHIKFRSTTRTPSVENGQVRAQHSWLAPL